MLWDSEPFYTKSKLYIQKSESLDSEDRFYVFWHFLAYEFLVKSCVAHKSKALLADPRSSQNLLFSLGIEVTKTPSQRPINELLELMKSFVPQFTDEEYKKSLSWINFRNEEIHTASDRLTEVAGTGWLGDYYRITKILLGFLGKSVPDYFGKDREQTIEKVIKELKEEVLAEVKKEINASKAHYGKLKDVEKELIRKSFVRPQMTKVAKCPACEEIYAVIQGELIKASEPALEDGDLYTTSRYLPLHLKCSMCRLDLKGFSAINSVGLGAEFTLKEYVDPITHFEIDIEREYHDMYSGRDEYMDE